MKTSLLFACIQGAVLLAGAPGQQRPPTLDPTYGFPVLPISTTPVWTPPDAKWIWAAKTRDNQTIYVQKSFTLATRPTIASLYVTADNFFTAYVNGHLVGETHDEKVNDSIWAQVQEYRVAKLLHTGTNLISIEARNAGGAAGVLARLHINYRAALFSDSSWRVTETKPFDGWTSALQSDATWTPATVVGPASGDPWGSQLKGWPAELDPAPPYLKHLRVDAKRWAFVTAGIEGLVWHPFHVNQVVSKPAGWPSEREVRVLLDFGDELSGRIARVDRYVWFSILKPLDVGTGESIGEAIQKPYTRARLGGGGMKGPYSAFRYACVRFSPGTYTNWSDLYLDHLYYPVQYAGSFDCSDPLLTKIWYTGAYTAHLCMQQDVWDAPKRDRARWMGDLHVSGEVINDVFADRFLMEQTMRKLREEAQGGQPADKLPRQHVNGIPGYSCAWIAGMADFYRHTGDLAFLKSQHRALVSLLEYMRGEIGPDGIFANKYGQWPFVDWAPEFNKDTPSARAATQLFYVKAVREGVFLLHALGDEQAAQVNQGWADLLTLAAQAKLVSQTGTFGDRRQENAMAIYSGVATPDQRARIFDQIFRSDRPAWKYQATPYYDNYVIYAMSEAGHTREALDFVRKYWGGMLAEGATTFWEAYDPSWDKHNAHVHLQADDGTGYFVSLCHGWSAGATSWLTECVLGIRPTRAGFETCDIQPDLAGLTWASGVVPTPHGPIRVRLDRVGKGLRAHIYVPQGVAAQVILPGRPPVTVSGGNLVLRS